MMTPASASGPWSRIWLEGLAVALIAMLVRAASLDQSAYTDELYHMLAASGWLAEGELRIADGLYTRAWLYTMLTAGAFRVFGESLEVARWLAVAFGSLLVLVLFVWTRSVAGAIAAWGAALLLCFSPDAIIVSRFARFYALHGLLFFIGALGTYALVEWRLSARTRALLAPGVVLCFALALHLQVTTAIGLAGVFLWLMVRLLPRFGALLPTARVRRAAFLVTALALSILIVLVWQSDFGIDLWRRLRSTASWAESNRNVFWYYHVTLIKDYASLWPLTPLAVLIGLVARPRPTLFCLLVFGSALVVHSIAGMKNMRYVYYVLPFLFVIWAIALQEVWERLRASMLRTSQRALSAIGLENSRPMHLALACVVGLFVLGSNGAAIRSAALVAGLESVMPVRDLPRWEAARPYLEPWLQEADVVVTASELETLYYFDRYDVLVSKTRADELDPHADFDLDPRTGRAVVTTPASLELLMDCFRQGLIVTPSRLWRMAPHIDDELARWIIEHTRPLDLPPGLRMMAFVWDHPVTAGEEQCAPVETLTAAERTAGH